MAHSRTEEVIAEIKGFFTGPRTFGDSAVPPIVFVAVNAFAGLQTAAAVAVVVALGFVAYRIARGRPALYALGGVAGVAIAAGVALRFDRAEGYFLPGIISNAAYALGAAVSVVLRKPLVAYTSWFFHRWPLEWYWRRDVRPAYSEVTIAWAVFFAARGWVQFELFRNQQAELLAVVKIVSGTPAVLGLLIASYLYGTWRLGRLRGPSIAEFRAGDEPPFTGRHEGF